MDWEEPGGLIVHGVAESRPYWGDQAHAYGTDMDTDTDLGTGDGAEINTHTHKYWSNMIWKIIQGERRAWGDRNTGKILTLCLRTRSTEFKGSLTNVSGSEIES